MIAPMREVQRRKRLRKAIATGEAEASAQIAKLLDQRYSAIKRDLRRAHLRTRLKKGLRTEQALYDALVKDQSLGIDNTQARLVYLNALEKALGDSWFSWIADFINGVKQSLSSIVNRVQDVESQYWLTRGGAFEPVDPQKVIAAYEARTGRQIANIGEDTKQDVLNEISRWYNSDEDFPTLITNLGQWFSPARAETIARSETAHIASQVALDAMEKFGIDFWNFDLTPHENTSEFPCQRCVDYAAQNPHKRGDKMPPLHPRCDDGVVYVMED